MAITIYWKYDNYLADTKDGLAFHFNSNQARLHKETESGDHVYALSLVKTVLGLHIYLLADLVINRKTMNPTGYKYGKYRIWADEHQSRYFKVGDKSLTPLLNQLDMFNHVAYEEPQKWAQAIQTIRRLSDQDAALIAAFAESLPLHPNLHYRVPDAVFKLDTEYRRRDLHKRYGGQRQGGISTPSEHNFIMLFTGETGHRYGYEDQWSDDGALFFYTGEGQRGDMKFKGGNLAIRDHVANGKVLHLFEASRRGYVRYVGQMAYVSFHERLGGDIDGNMRKLIIFELAPIGWQAAEEYESPEGRAVTRLHTKRERNPNLVRMKKKQVLSQEGELRCEVCLTNPKTEYGELGESVIECHHKVPLSKLHPEWKTKLSDLAIVCANCHRALHGRKEIVPIEQLRDTIAKTVS